jgi:serine/threonine-protein kinase
VECAALVARLARGLAAAHQVGVMHHDIKPRNVIVTVDGRVVLVDFGLAWLRAAQGQGEEAAASPGTLAYRAPEHASGEGEGSGPTSDVFSLGGVLYFLLTGKAPFAAPDAALVLQKAMRCEYDEVALNRPGIPPRLARLCRHALAAKAEDRPRSAEAFAVELETLASERRPWRWWIGAAVVLALAGLVGLWALWSR